MTATITLRDVQQNALETAPDPGQGLHWSAASERLLVIDLVDLKRNVLGWIELTVRGWESIRLGQNSHTRTVHSEEEDPRLAMQALLFALKEGR